MIPIQKFVIKFRLLTMSKIEPYIQKRMKVLIIFLDVAASSFWEAYIKFSWEGAYIKVLRILHQGFASGLLQNISWSWPYFILQSCVLLFARSFWQKLPFLQICNTV